MIERIFRFSCLNWKSELRVRLLMCEMLPENRQAFLRTNHLALVQWIYIELEIFAIYKGGAKHLYSWVPVLFVFRISFWRRLTFSLSSEFSGALVLYCRD